MGIIETVKDVATLVQKADNIELYHKILDLQVQIMDLVEQNHSLRSELIELRDRSRFEQGLEFRENMYWHKVGPDTYEGPFCSKCWDDEQKAVRFHKQKDGGMWCPKCMKYATGTRPPILVA
jgi:hypothetical protein